MIDLVREIKGVALGAQAHDDVHVSLRGDVEVAWNSVYLEVALDLASLFLVEFFLDLFHEIHSILHLIQC